MADINGNVTWTATGFSTAILTALVPEYIIVSNILGNYLRNSHVEGGRFAPARTCLINMLGAKGNRIIEEVKADGYCGYGACEIINNFFGQQMGPSMAAGRARGETWIQQDNILDDLHAAGKYNADGTPPFLVIKFCVRCDETCPIASIHLLISGGLLPVCETLTLRAAVQMVHEHEKPMLILYEIENHPQVGGDRRGRHFEVMLPTDKFLAERAKLREAAAKPGRKRKEHDEFLEKQQKKQDEFKEQQKQEEFKEQQKQAFARANSAGSSAKGC